MADPLNQIVSGWDKWRPHQSIVGGGSVGTLFAVLTLPFVLPLYPKGVDTNVITGAYTGLCVFIASYFIPDSQSRS